MACAPAAIFLDMMDDAINAGDESDRLLMAWRVTDPDEIRRAALRDGTALPEDATVTARVPTPDDVVSLRRTDLAAVAGWRGETRAAITAALERGDRVLGFTRDGEYVIGRSATRAASPDGTAPS